MDLVFKIYPGYTFLQPLNDETRTLIDSISSFRPDGYFYSPLYRRGWWDGWYRFRKRNKIPTGIYLTLIKDELDKQKVNYKEEWGFQYPEPKHIDYHLDGIELRDYQITVIEQALKEKRCIIKLPTNAGKTEVAMALIQSFGLPFLFVTHRKELFYQTYERIQQRMNITPGLVGDGNKRFEFENGMIMMIQTLKNLDSDQKDKVLSIPLLIMDEIHHFGSDNTWYRLLSNSSSLLRFGLTATPIRDNAVCDWQLRSLTGKIIGDITNEYLIQEGYSTPPEIHLVRCNYNATDITESYDKLRNEIYVKYRLVLDRTTDLKIAKSIEMKMELELRKIKSKEYREVYIRAISNPFRYDLISFIVKIHKDKQILILLDRIEQGNKLKEKLDSSVFMYGSSSQDFRRNVMNAFKNGEIKLLISTLLDEGVDIPNIQVLIFASPMRSIVKVLQRIGRGMRKHDSKEILLVYDIIDVGTKYFVNQAKERQKIYKNEKFNIIDDK